MVLPSVILSAAKDLILIGQEFEFKSAEHPSVILSAAKDLILIGQEFAFKSAEHPQCHPERSEGSRPHRPGSSSLPFFTQISPLRIDGLDQGHLLCAQPTLDLLLPRESSVHIGSLFKVNQACNMVPVCKACHQVMLVFVHAPLEGIGDAYVAC